MRRTLLALAVVAALPGLLLLLVALALVAPAAAVAWWAA